MASHYTDPRDFILHIRSELIAEYLKKQHGVDFPVGKKGETREECADRFMECRAAYYEAGIAIHELTLRAKELYLSPKATVDDKRLLLSYVFSEISLNNKKITAKHTYAFEFLAEWMPKVNKNFEPTKNPSVSGASSVVISSTIEPMAPEANKNFEPQKTLILRHDSDVLDQNHDNCSAARTRTHNFVLPFSTSA